MEFYISFLSWVPNGDYDALCNLECRAGEQHSRGLWMPETKPNPKVVKVYGINRKNRRKK